MRCKRDLPMSNTEKAIEMKKRMVEDALSNLRSVPGIHEYRNESVPNDQRTLNGPGSVYRSFLSYLYRIMECKRSSSIHYLQVDSFCMVVNELADSLRGIGKNLRYAEVSEVTKIINKSKKKGGNALRSQKEKIEHLSPLFKIIDSACDEIDREFCQIRKSVIPPVGSRVVFFESHRNAEDLLINQCFVGEIVSTSWIEKISKHTKASYVTNKRRSVDRHVVVLSKMPVFGSLSDVGWYLSHKECHNGPARWFLDDSMVGDGKISMEAIVAIAGGLMVYTMKEEEEEEEDGEGTVKRVLMHGSSPVYWANKKMEEGCDCHFEKSEMVAISEIEESDLDDGGGPVCFGGIVYPSQRLLSVLGGGGGEDLQLTPIIGVVEETTLGVGPEEVTEKRESMSLDVVSVWVETNPADVSHPRIFSVEEDAKSMDVEVSRYLAVKASSDAFLLLDPATKGNMLMSVGDWEIKKSLAAKRRLALLQKLSDAGISLEDLQELGLSTQV